MIINHNMASLNTYRQLSTNNVNSSKSLEKLSSGLRINKAGDDAAGLAISEKMRGQIRGLDQAARNSQDAISLIQTAEGSLSETHSILQRMRELATQAANDTNATADRDEIQKELNQLTSEINRIGNTTEFNTQKLLKGDIAITGNGRELDGAANLANAGGKLSNVVVDPNAAIETGNYKLEVNKVTTNEVSGSQISSTNLGVADIDVSKVNVVAQDTSLEEGAYKVTITEDNVKAMTAAGATGDIGILNTAGGTSQPISVLSDSTLDYAQHIIQVEKTITQDFNEINAGGITLTTATGGSVSAAGNYTIKTDAVVDLTELAVTDNAGDDLLSANGGPLSNLTLATNSTYKAADGYKIVLEQSGTQASAAATANALTDAGAVDFSGQSITLNGQGINLTSMGSITDLNTSKNDVVSKLQTAINSVYDGTQHGGSTFTVGLDGLDNLTITADQGGPESEVTVTASTGGTNATLGFAGTETDTGAADTADNVTMAFKLVNSANELVESTTASFTDTSGSTAIKLGDFSFNVDNQAMYASDADPTDPGAASTYSGAELDFGGAAGAIEYKVTVTAGDGSYKETQIEQNAGLQDNQAITLDQGSSNDQVVTMDIDTSKIVAGNAYAVAVTNNASYDIKLYQDNGGTAGSVDGTDTQIGGAAATITLTGADLNDASKITNVQVGGAGAGILVDFDKTQLEALANNADKQIKLTIEQDTRMTAQVFKANGDAVSGYSQTTLNENSVAAENLSIGEDISLHYATGADLKEGDVFFSVNAGVTNFDMSLIDTNTGEVKANKAFNEGENVDFDTYGVSVDTAAGVADAANATFKVKTGVQDNSLQMQIGANAGQSFSVDINDMRSATLKVAGNENDTQTVIDNGVSYTAKFTSTKTVTNGTTSDGAEAALDVSTHENATAAVKVINNAIEAVSSERSKLGAFSNRLEHTITNLGTSAENMTAAESRIRDVDMAKEMMQFQKNNILSQAAQAMLAQANQQPQGVLQLLR